MSHKLCTSPHHRGPRWTLCVFFHASGWDTEGDKPLRYQSHCQACQRVENRIRKGIKNRGRPYEARKPSKLRMPTTYDGKSGYRPRNAVERKRLKLYRKRRYRKLSRKQLDERRQYQREYAMLRRRDVGIPIRALTRGAVEREEIMRLPVTQEFKDWLASAFANHRFLGVEENTGIAHKQIHRILRGENATIEIDMAERLLLYANGPMVWEIWPAELGV